MRLGAVLSIFLGGAVVNAQSLASLTGTITDSSGAVVPHVAVHIVNSETGEPYTATSNGSGVYMLPLIKPGEYQLTAELQGFKRYTQTGLTLETSAQQTVDIRLELGSAAESVTVDAAAPPLSTESSTVGAVVENRTIVNMPLINRRAAQLARLNGFVVQNGTGSNFTMAGGRGDNAMWLIDGGNAQNVTLGVQTLNFDPPVESLQEFSVSISNYAAELGRSGGGVVQMTTKSGTNQFHGSVYEYFRNDAMDARTFFSAAKPKLRYNLYGASLGGPIRKDKTHFFFNYEGIRQKNESTQILNLPTPAEARGDFSANSSPIRDPAAAGRPPFPGNIIPANRLDPIGLKLAAFFPAPNVAGRPSGNSNFRTNAPETNPTNAYVARIDHIFREQDRMYGRLLTSNGSTIDAPIYDTPGVDTFHRLRYNTYYNASVTWFHNLSSTVINEFRYTYDRRTFINRVGGAHSGLAGRLGILGVNPDFFPRIVLAGYTGLGNNSNQERLQVPIRTDHIADNITWIHGNHRFKGGWEYRIASNLDQNLNSAGGIFTFNDVATGNAVASMLLGWAQQGQRDEAEPVQSRANTMGAYFQDDWKVTPRLTLNLGLRWDVDQPRWEQLANRQNSFDRAAINPVSGTPGVVTFSGRNGLSKYAHNFDWNNIGPRFGLAWRVSDKWVIRAGAAIVYTGEYDSATPLVATLGFSKQGDFVSPDNGLTPAFILRDGLPALRTPGEADLTPALGAVKVGQPTTTAVEFFEPNGRSNGYLETFNFNIQRQLSNNFVLELGYLGTLGHKLPTTTNFTIDQVPVDQMGPGNAQVRRPFPQYSGVGVVSAAIGNSVYHGMNLRAEKRYSQGLLFQANYTFAKQIDDVESRNELGGGPGDAFQNIYDRRADRGLSGNSIKHRFIFSSVYELPFAKQNRLLGGWAAGYIAELRTGPPFGVVEQTNRTNAFSPSQRPNLLRDPALPGGRSRAEIVRQYFDVTAFQQPAQFTFGNASRSIGYGPGAVTMDLSLLKDFRFGERHTIQFRVEALNFINRPNFGSPVLQRGNASFGRINSLAAGNQARIIQLGLHYKF